MKTLRPFLFALVIFGISASTLHAQPSIAVGAKLGASLAVSEATMPEILAFAKGLEVVFL